MKKKYLITEFDIHLHKYSFYSSPFDYIYWDEPYKDININKYTSYDSDYVDAELYCLFYFQERNEKKHKIPYQLHKDYNTRKIL